MPSDLQMNPNINCMACLAQDFSDKFIHRLDDGVAIDRHGVAHASYGQAAFGLALAACEWLDWLQDRRGEPTPCRPG